MSVYGSLNSTSLAVNTYSGKHYGSVRETEYDRLPYFDWFSERQRPINGRLPNGRFTSTPFSREGGTLTVSPSVFTSHWYSEWEVNSIHQLVDIRRIGTFKSVEVGNLADNAFSRARTGALLGLRGQNRPQFGADLAESKKTLNMIAQLTSQILRAYRAAKVGNWNNVAGYLGLKKKNVLSGRFPANKWLEYQYGWKPVLNSIYDLYRKLGDGIRDRDAYYVSRSRANDTFSFSGEETGDSMGGVFLSFEWEVKCQCALHFQISSSVIDVLDGSGLLNPLEVAWELVPFSFVLDWFIPIGNVLQAISAPAGLTCSGGYESSLQTKRFVWTRTQNPGENPPFRLVSSGSTVANLFVARRKLITGFPLPQLYANTNPFRTGRVVNALALTRQLL